MTVPPRRQFRDAPGRRSTDAHPAPAPADPRPVADAEQPGPPAAEQPPAPTEPPAGVVITTELASTAVVSGVWDDHPLLPRIEEALEAASTRGCSTLYLSNTEARQLGLI